jgi:hypothetical protein
MTALTSISSAKPRHSDDTILLAGTKAYTLAIQYQPTLTPRLPATTVADLADDLKQVRAAVPGATQARAEARVTLATQRTLLRKATKLLGGIRKSVRRQAHDPDIRKAYGVGMAVSPLVVKQVVAVLTLIQDRAAKYPAEPPTLGVAQKDLDAVKQALADIDAAFDTRQKKRVEAPLSTKRRNQLLNRIFLAAGDIAAAGQLEFVADPEIAQSFAAILPPPSPRKKPAAKKPTAAKPPKAAKPAAPAADPAAAAPAASPDPAPTSPANDAPPAPAAATTPAEAATPAAPPAAA